jgi:hypothetical protein
MDEHQHPRPAPHHPVTVSPGLLGFDADAVLRRSRRVNPGPWLSLVFVALLALAALATGHWIAALAIAAVLLPDRILAIREDQDELRALATRDDFLDALKARVERQMLLERSNFLLRLAGAAALALLSRTQPEAAPMLVVSAGILAWGILRFAVVAPRLVRELEDLGGSTQAGWVVALVFTTFVIAAPFLVLYGVLRRTVRRVRGLPPEPEERDS